MIESSSLVYRAYGTRQGAGPFVTEDSVLTRTISDMHNGAIPWQCEFRVGHLDLVAARYVLEVTDHIDGLVVTNIDLMKDIPHWKIVNAYQYAGQPADLSGHFVHDVTLINGITVCRPFELKHQEWLTQLFSRCTPQYQYPLRDVNAYLAYLDKP